MPVFTLVRLSAAHCKTRDGLVELPLVVERKQERARGQGRAGAKVGQKGGGGGGEGNPLLWQM